MATQAEIRLQIRQIALSRLGVVAAGETPSAADVTRADEALSTTVDRLAAAGGVFFTADTLPDTAVAPLVELLAEALADDFGVDEAKARRLFDQAELARRELRAQVAAGPAQGVSFANF